MSKRLILSLDIDQQPNGDIVINGAYSQNPSARRGLQQLTERRVLVMDYNGDEQRTVAAAMAQVNELVQELTSGN